MKRILLCFAAMLSCLALFAGCAALQGNGDSPQAGSTKRDNIPFSDGQLYAAAYLGYQQMTDFDFYADRYLDSDKIPIHYFSDGDYYLVIPRYSGMMLSLYRNEMEAEASVLVYEDPDCRPFILQCNASDIFSDATIRLSYAGEDTEFSPFLSLRDGAVEIGPAGLDITKEENHGS